MSTIRPPSVAGYFYPEQKLQLTATVNKFLALPQERYTQPKALIVPHAGYIYSGAVAGSAYATLLSCKDTIKKVVLIGPAHKMYFRGIAATAVDFFATPLGEVQLVQDIGDLLSIPEVHINEQAYHMEHCLEVQLPFLQTVLEEFTLLPLLVGDVEAEVVAQVLQKVWGEEQTLIVVSSDLSHYLTYDAAKQIDALTSNAIVTLTPEKLQHEQACGMLPIQGLLQLAKKYNLAVKVLDLRNSGDTAGSKDRVVGYGAYHFSEQRQ